MSGKSLISLLSAAAVVVAVAIAIWLRSGEAVESATTPPTGIPRLVDLGATECIPCKKLAPILEELREEYEGRLSVEFIDVWQNPGAGDPFHIKLIPTQILYTAGGEEVWRHEGFISKEDLVSVFASEVGVE